MTIDMSAARRQFRDQRACAKARQIEWLLSFEDWLEVWRSSGRYAERGRGRGKFCMARYQDMGPYSAGNVYITTHEQNVEEARRLRAPGGSPARGWTYMRDQPRHPYSVQCRKRYIGSYATAAEAEAAYRVAAAASAGGGTFIERGGHG